ncbi:hypothetical protein P7C70_g8284, partial [Phenoliferia sp. Uapishka_3]
LHYKRLAKAAEPQLASAANIDINISDITELRRTAGLGWKGRMAAGWVLGAQSSVGDGIQVVWKEEGEDGKEEEEKVTRFSAIVRRDELFNRLASVGPQKFSHL